MLRTSHAFILTGLLVALTLPTVAQTPDKAAAGGEKPSPSMPVRELTVFKDGHAFVLQEGKMPVENGQVVLDYLPTPVMGTFWPYSADEKTKLVSVTSSQRIVAMDTTVLSLRELLEANVGAEVTIREQPTGVKDEAIIRYDATILDVPTRSTAELEQTSPPGTPPALPQRANILLLKTADGTKAVNIDRIMDVTFKGGAPKTTGKTPAFRNALRMKLDFGGEKAPAQAQVGMIYLQKGFRWIPSYKISVDGKGQAKIKMEATLVNELTDLDDATVHLVIGAPTFAMEDVVDPIALQQNLAALSQHFRTGTRFGRQDISNAMMTQVASNSNMEMPEGPAVPLPADLGAAIPGGNKVEDLFVFLLQHVNLKKGQRMVVPVAEFTVKYQDVYTLDLPASPPPEVWRSMGNDRQMQLAKMLNQPKVMHKIRLANSTASPFTTAPALVLMDNRLMAQGLMLYTPAGAEVDLAITPAIDIAVRKTETETARAQKAAVWEKTEYLRVELDGTISLLSRKKEAIEVEVTRMVIGNIDKADNDGKIQMLNVLEDDAVLSGAPEPFWWSWYNWPYWWSHFNGMGKVTWKVKLEPGKKTELKYSWDYFWR